MASPSIAMNATFVRPVGVIILRQVAGASAGAGCSWVSWVSARRGRRRGRRRAPLPRGCALRRRAARPHRMPRHRFAARVRVGGRTGRRSRGAHLDVRAGGRRRRLGCVQRAAARRRAPRGAASGGAGAAWPRDGPRGHRGHHRARRGERHARSRGTAPAEALCELSLSGDCRAARRGRGACAPSSAMHCRGGADSGRMNHRRCRRPETKPLGLCQGGDSHAHDSPAAADAHGGAPGGQRCARERAPAAHRPPGGCILRIRWPAPCSGIAARRPRSSRSSCAPPVRTPPLPSAAQRCRATREQRPARAAKCRPCAVGVRTMRRRRRRLARGAASARRSLQGGACTARRAARRPLPRRDACACAASAAKVALRHSDDVPGLAMLSCGGAQERTCALESEAGRAAVSASRTSV